MPPAIARATSSPSSLASSSAARRVVSPSPRPEAALGLRRMPPPARAAAASSSSSSSSAPAPNPLRQALTGLASAVYKMQAPKADPRLPPLWQAIERLDADGVAAALRAGASADTLSPLTNETPLAFIAKKGGHYKYPPAGIPSLLIEAGADLEKRDQETGHTALELALLKGWQNIAYRLLDAGADTSGVAAIKGKLTCPDCKRLVAEKGL